MDNKFKHIFEEQSDSSIIVKVPMIRVYLPIDYFEHHISEIVGSDVETLCVFNFDTFGENVKEYTEPSTLKSKRYLFKLPVNVHMSPTTITQERDPESLRLMNILEFYEGDTFIKTTNVTKDWKVVNKILELLIRGFMPKELRYDEILDFMNNSMSINDTSLNVVDTILEIMIAELTRDPIDVKKPFRIRLHERPNTDIRNKQFIKVEELGRLNNTFAAISSGDPKQGITRSVTRYRKGEKQKESSIEKAITDM